MFTLGFLGDGRHPAPQQSDKARHRAVRLRGPLAAVVVSSVSFFANAQLANCNFDVSRDTVTNTTSRAPTLALDGALITRFALGLRGAALYEKLSQDQNRFVGEGNTGTNVPKLDVDGDGVFTMNDATIAARFIAGFRDGALMSGLTPTLAATRKTGTELTAFINGGCPVQGATTNMQKNAARLLQQGTFGATLAEINRVSALGGDTTTMTNAWLAEQFAKTGSTYANYSQQIINENKTAAFDWRCSGDNKSWGCAYAANTPAFFKRAMEGEDQLRQRVTNALWQTLVVSISNNTVLDSGVGLSSYWDMLSTNVFGPNTVNANKQTVDPVTGLGVGNFRKILRDMTLHPAMGVFLDMLGSTQEVPNENYARELLQLFSVGTVMLNLDASPQLQGGKTIPTYDEDVVKGFAKALTGWHFAGADGDATKAWWFYWYPNRDYTASMQPWTMRRCPQDSRWPPGTTTGWCDIKRADQSYPPPHNLEAKKLLQYSGARFPNLDARAAPVPGANEDHLSANVRKAIGDAANEDLERAMDNVFYHPNVGPLIARQLIQRLVTSNPSSGYVSRVAAVFNDSNGDTVAGGTRGDMREVVKAIFLDSEARDVSVAANRTFGKLREPVIKFVQLHRAFGARETQEGFYDVWDTSGPDTLGQSAMKPPSVFNYYSPDFGPSGPLTYTQTRPSNELGARATEPLYGPEFEITSTSSIAGFSEFWGWGVYRGFAPGYSGNGQTRNLRWTPDHASYLALADTPQALVDTLDLLLTANNLKPAFKANLVAMANGIVRTLPPNYTSTDVPNQREQRFQAVYWQIVNSADYAIQR